MGPLQVGNEERVVWVTKVMEMINTLDPASFAQQEMAFILMLSIHCEP